MRKSGVFLLVLVIGSCMFGRTKVTTSMVHYMSGNDTVTAYLNVPDGQGPFPGLIIIHEWWGLNDWVKDNAKMLAGRGYVTLAIDLYRGRVADNPDVAHELMRGLPEDRATRDLVAADNFLKSRGEVNKSKIGTLGWCMGGGYSLATALNVPDLASCIICYGRLATDSSSVAKISCPLLGIFGTQDAGITPKDVRDFESLLKKMGKKIEVKEYEDAGHAFMNPNNTTGYKKSDTKDAWSKIQKFLDRTLNDGKEHETRQH
jgi:carboxymethylenebutenolidase